MFFVISTAFVEDEASEPNSFAKILNNMAVWEVNTITKTKKSILGIFVVWNFRIVQDCDMALDIRISSEKSKSKRQAVKQQQKFY